MKTKVHEILNIYFERKKMANPSYSLRALARDLTLSPAYVSTILSGKKALPEARLKYFIKILELDDIAILQLKSALSPKKTIDKEIDGLRLGSDEINFLNKYKPLDKKKYEILNNWYNIVIMDLTTCNGFKNDPSWIARALGINQLEVEMAIENLKRHNLLEEINGKLQKVDLKLRFPTCSSQVVIRKFHKQMIKKAYEELDKRTEENELNNRLVVGATFAINHDKLDLLKEKIQNVLYEVSSSASEGPCQSVYQLNIQFFPLSR